MSVGRIAKLILPSLIVLLIGIVLLPAIIQTAGALFLTLTEGPSKARIFVVLLGSTVIAIGVWIIRFVTRGFVNSR